MDYPHWYGHVQERLSTHGVGFFGEADFVQEVGAPAFVQLGKLDATKIGMKPALQRIIGLVNSRPWVMNCRTPLFFFINRTPIPPDLSSSRQRVRQGSTISFSDLDAPDSNSKSCGPSSLADRRPHRALTKRLPAANRPTD